MVFLKVSSRCLSLSQQIRCLHRSTFLLARNVRRTASPQAQQTPPIKLDQRMFANDEYDDMSTQEQFARLELRRLEQESRTSTADDNATDEEFDEQDPPRPSIDPSTTSIILFPGQGTQFVGMG